MQSALLSNSEVQAHVLAVKQKHATAQQAAPQAQSQNQRATDASIYKGQLRDLHLVLDDVARYFAEHQSASGTADAAAQQNSSTAAVKDTSAASSVEFRFLQGLKAYYLTKTELLMLLNLRPQNVEQLEPLIEDVSERFSEAQQLEILAVVAEELGSEKAAG